MRGTDAMPRVHRIRCVRKVGDRIGGVGGGRVLRIGNRFSREPSPPGLGTGAETGESPSALYCPRARGFRRAAYTKATSWLAVFTRRRHPDAGEPPSDASIVSLRASRVNESVVATRETRQWTRKPYSGLEASMPRRRALPTVQGVACAKRIVSHG